jgi:hypothetical protein
MHKTILSINLAIILLFLAGCASNLTFPLTKPSQSQQGDVIVFRESAFAAGGVTLTVGANGKAFANLGNSDKVLALLPAGDHEIFVQARSAEPTRVTISLTAGSLVCLRTSSSPSTYAKVIIPITLIVTGYHFYLDQVPCPPDAELAKYTNVTVTYQ